ncbi:MAG: hypothetical protein ABEI74_03080 [Candidatus Pacearchaeota archaeon]
MALEEGDIVLGTVRKIAGTIVFVDIEGEDREGSIILSEVAPGRIRNLRNYVVPKKTIVCKVLNVSNDRVDLSLRRVTQKEKQEMMNIHKLEKSYSGVIKNTVGKDKYEEVINKIKEQDTIYNFIEESKENPEQLEKIVGKENAEKILDIINKQKTKKREIKRQIYLTSQKPNGLEIIQNLLDAPQDIEVSYVAAGKYSLKTEGEDVKKADQKIKDFLEKVEDQAKKQGATFSIAKK